MSVHTLRLAVSHYNGPQKHTVYKNIISKRYFLFAKVRSCIIKCTFRRNKIWEALHDSKRLSHDHRFFYSSFPLLRIYVLFCFLRPDTQNPQVTDFVYSVFRPQQHYQSWFLSFASRSHKNNEFLSWISFSISTYLTIYLRDKGIKNKQETSIQSGWRISVPF
jgi:hypothetical protein